jgi:hypothetical protein
MTTTRNKIAGRKILPDALAMIARNSRLGARFSVRTVIDATVEIAADWYGENAEDARSMGHFAALAWVASGKPTQ